MSTSSKIDSCQYASPAANDLKKCLLLPFKRLNNRKSASEFGVSASNIPNLTDLQKTALKCALCKQDKKPAKTGMGK
jgi:hypothetical protein